MRAGDSVQCVDEGPVSPDREVIGVGGASSSGAASSGASGNSAHKTDPEIDSKGFPDFASEVSEDEDDVLQLDEEVQRKSRVEDAGAVKKIVDPRKPSEQEVQDHELTHIPYSYWCHICVRCKGKDMDHRTAVEGERSVSEYALDYCFPGDEFGFKLVVLAGREKVMGMYFATAKPTKGSIGRFAVDKVLDFVDELGDRGARIIVKSDQEPAIKTLIKDVVEAREEGRTIVEESPVRSSGSNGRAERAVQTLEGHIRVLLLGLESRLGRSIDAKEPVVTYMPEYAAYLLNRLDVGKDGKAAYERCKGKKATVLGIEFGEKVLYKLRPESKQAKIRARWEPGIFVGVRPRSGEVWIATPDKTLSVRSIRRLPMDQRWGDDSVRWPRRTLWNRSKDDLGADGDLPEAVPQSVAPPVEPRGGVVFLETRDKVPRDFYIKKTDADKHGYTRGCAGCSSWFRGLGRQPHTEACRERFRGLMRDEAKVQHAEGKRKEFEEEQAEKRRRKEEKARRKRKAEEEADDTEKARREHQGGGAEHEREEGRPKHPRQLVVPDGGEPHQREERGTKNPQQPVV